MVHNHGIDPMCAESVVSGRLRGECMPDEPIRDPQTIRNLLEHDWANSYEPVKRRVSGRDMWIDVHADHNQETTP